MQTPNLRNGSINFENCLICAQTTIVIATEKKVTVGTVKEDGAFIVIDVVMRRIYEEAFGKKNRQKKRKRF